MDYLDLCHSEDSPRLCCPRPPLVPVSIWFLEGHRFRIGKCSNGFPGVLQRDQGAEGEGSTRLREAEAFVGVRKEEYRSSGGSLHWEVHRDQFHPAPLSRHHWRHDNLLPCSPPPWAPPPRAPAAALLRPPPLAVPRAYWARRYLFGIWPCVTIS